MAVEINGKLNTDWRVEFLGRTIGAPEPKLSSVDIPLRDGTIDLTEALDGRVRYNNREIVMRFEIIKPKRIEWEHLMLEIFNSYHGQRVEVSFEDDSDHVWHGRASVSGLEDHGSTAGFTITVIAEPYRRTRNVLYSEVISTFSGSSVTRELKIPHARGYLHLENTSDTGYSFYTLNFNDGVSDTKINATMKTYDSYLPTLYGDTTLTITATRANATFKLEVYGGDL